MPRVVDCDNLTESIMKYMKTSDEAPIESTAAVQGSSENEVFPPEELAEIDPAITPSDMLTVIYAEIDRKKIAGHHIESMNSFNKIGIKQIMTKVFVLEGRIKNEREKTAEDKEIAEITYRVDFTNVDLTRPSTVRYKSGTAQMLTPNAARLNNLTYSVQMYIDATITATAILKNGTPRVRTAELRNHRVASIPCAVGTELCNTYNCSMSALKEMEEDPLTPGGYFIIKGVEWVVDNLENITNNTFHVYKNMYKDEYARGTFLSKPGDAYENSYQIVLRYLNTGAITMEITTNKFDKFEIPFYVIFRALGMNCDYDIVDNIVYGAQNTDYNSEQLKQILETAFDADAREFEPIKRSVDSAEIVQFIANTIISVAQKSAASKDDNVAKYLNTNILSIMDRYVFPHIGKDPENRITKLRFFGHLINKLLCVFMGISPPTDRDSYKNKRITASGTSCAKTLKTVVNFVIIQEVKKQFKKDFTSTPFSFVQLAESVKAAINSDDLERMLVTSIVTGNKTITIKRNEISNRLSSQQLTHKNNIYVISTLNTINTPNPSNASNQNERADMMRRFHALSKGYICPTQSAESGDKVGLSKQMACTASICGASSSYVLKKKISEDPQVMRLDDVAPARITAERLTKVFVNGDWVGCHRPEYDLVRYYRTARRRGKIHHLTSIVWNDVVREAYFWTDVGRVMRPLIIVYSNIDAYNAASRAGAPIKFQQWIKLTKDHIRGLRARKIDMDDLRHERVLEYVSAEEQENLFVADNISKLREHAHDITFPYSHCDIDQAIFGIVALAAPFANHSDPHRNTLFTVHRKTSAGWFALNYPFRIDKNVTLQHYCEKPLVSSFSDVLTYPNGQNCIVALALHGGENQEDSVVINKSSVDCGLFNASFYNYEKSELDKNEKFGNEDFARTIDIKKNACYEHIADSGLIKRGTIAQKGDVLIVKSATLPKPKDDYAFVDKSVVYNRSEPVYIEQSIITRNDEDIKVAKIKYRADRPLGVGDKLCLAEDHEILTIAGFKNVVDISMTDLIATNCGGHIKYVRPARVYRYAHEGDMCRVMSDHVCGLVTMNHRMYVGRNDKWELCEAREVMGASAIYSNHGAHCSDKVYHFRIGAHIFNMQTWLRFLGIFVAKGALADGKILFKNLCDNEIRCVQTLTKIEPQDATRTLWVCRSDYLYDELQSYGGAMPYYVFNLNYTQSCDFLDAILMDKRTVEEVDDHFRYYPCTTHDYCEEIVRVCVNAGYYARVHEKYLEFRQSFYSSVEADAYEVVQYSGYVYCVEVENHVFMTRYRGTHYWTGNSSKCGNKGIVSLVVPRCDMPYTEDGMVPDILVSALSVTTRMAVAQIAECVQGILAALRGSHIDATAFRNFDLDAVVGELRKHGVKFDGHRRMYNGKTGEWIDTLIFVGSNTYQRIQKFVIDERYVIRTGPTSALTRQPLAGKSNDGGLRLGEMEKDVLAGHGTIRQIFSKFYKDCDGIKIFVCRICNNRAVVNEKEGVYNCKYCGDDADIARVDSSWVANLFMNEISAMNIKMDLELDPYTYPKAQE